jgi:hypothetical protein
MAIEGSLDIKWDNYDPDLTIPKQSLPFKFRAIFKLLNGNPMRQSQIVGEEKVLAFFVDFCGDIQDKQREAVRRLQDLKRNPPTLSLGLVALSEEMVKKWFP